MNQTFCLFYLTPCITLLQLIIQHSEEKNTLHHFEWRIQPYKPNGTPHCY